MTAPALLVSIQGVTVESADNFNTFQQTCDTLAQLRGFVGTAGVQVFVRGGAAFADGLQGVFSWQLASNPTDDGVSVIVPYGSTGACWIRVPIVSQLVPSVTYTSGSTITLSAANYFVVVNKTSGSATTVNLPSTPAKGQVIIVKDGKGDARTNPITVGAGTYLIDGLSSYQLGNNYESISVEFDGAQWNVF